MVCRRTAKSCLCLLSEVTEVVVLLECKNSCFCCKFWTSGLIFESFSHQNLHKNQKFGSAPKFCFGMVQCIFLTPPLVAEIEEFEEIELFGLNMLEIHLLLGSTSVWTKNQEFCWFLVHRGVSKK